MINGEIDLSIGGVYLFAPFVFYELANAGLPLMPAVILSLLVAALVGLVNGFFIAVVGISSFVTTLGTLFTLDGPDADHLAHRAGAHARHLGRST